MQERTADLEFLASADVQGDISIDAAMTLKTFALLKAHLTVKVQQTYVDVSTQTERT